MYIDWIASMPFPFLNGQHLALTPRPLDELPVKHLKDVDDSVDRWIISWDHILVQKHPIQGEMEHMETGVNKYMSLWELLRQLKDVGSAAPWTMRTHECSKHLRMTCCGESTPI